MEKRFYVFEFDDRSFYMGYFPCVKDAAFFVSGLFDDLTYPRLLRVRSFPSFSDACTFYFLNDRNGGSDDE